MTFEVDRLVYLNVLYIVSKTVSRNCLLCVWCTRLFIWRENAASTGDC